MRFVTYVDKFSSGLDELTRKQQRVAGAVLDVIDRCGRFSVFEATANDVIARTMDRIVQGKMIVVDEKRSAYPRTYAMLSEAGRVEVDRWRESNRKGEVRDDAR